MKKTELVLGLLIIVLVAGLFVLGRQTGEQTLPGQHTQSSFVAESDIPLTSISSPPSAPTTRTNTRTPRSLSQAQAQTNQSPANELQDPDAREALAMVGMDDEADQYWLNAIFDTSLSDKEREDLMEDLNEVGFDDPENVTEDDLPLILNRIELIDAVLPNADDFMAEHLLEAEKDLVNMLASVTNPGQQ